VNLSHAINDQIPKFTGTTTFEEPTQQSINFFHL